MNTKFLAAAAALLLSSVMAFATDIVNLRTESLETPLGIDERRPLFSWQMSSSETGALQRAYRLLLSEDERNLSEESALYDSGIVFSPESINIEYAGPALRPCTRYFWKVIVTDGRGEEHASAPTWFETGIGSEGWSGAQWIGSEKTGLSEYRTFFNIEYTIRIPEGSSCGVFAYSVKDKDNYITVGLCLDGKPRVEVDYAVEGDRRHLSTIDVSDIITPENAREEHSIVLKVSTPGYHLKSNLIVLLDGKTLKPTEGVSKAPARENVSSGNPAQMVITPYPGGERVHDWARLHSIGFFQPKGQNAEFSNIRITEDNWKSTLYEENRGEVHCVRGNGRLQVWKPYDKVAAPMLRKAFAVKAPLKSARLYITARGIYDFYINGERVGRDRFNPGWTDYRYRIMYNSYDVTSMLCSGENAMGAMLGSGWYSDLNIFTSAYVDPYGIRQSLMAKMVLEYADGLREIVVSDGSWKKYDDGPIRRNGFQFGEDYDARKELDRWAESGFDDSAWEAVQVFERPDPAVEIQSYVGLPIRDNITLCAVSVSEPVKGTFVYDFGQNVVGVPRIEGMKGKRGDVLTLRYGEMIYPETIPTAPIEPYTKEVYERMKGQVYIENYRGAISIDTYILRGSAAGESYEPHFTDHGFRYLSITGLKAPLPISSVKAVVLESIGHTTSTFETSDPSVNRLFQNIQWGQRGNFQTVPTDCPQRDERQGWTGDAQVFARTATYFSPWVDKFYARWFYSMRDNQNRDGSYFNYYPVTGRPPYGFDNNNPGWIGWMDAGIIVPYQVFMQYGDTKVIEQHYESMCRYMDYLERQSSGYLQPSSGIGDHLAVEPTNIGLTNTAYYAYDALLMSRMAGALGKEADCARYAALYENVKKAFNERYMRSDGTTVAPYTPSPWARPQAGAPKPGELVTVDTQTSYALPLYFGLLDGELKEKAVQKLVENIERHGNTLTTGFIGTPYLNPVLSAAGRDDVAFALFEQTKCPSWLYPVLQGATTMWERWNSYTIENGFGPVDMNSFNHYAYGAIGEWMYAYLLGIQRDENVPGYRHIILQPRVGGSLSFAKGGFETPYGPVSASWEKKSKGGYVYKVKVPACTTASLTLQAAGISKVKVLKGADGIGPMRSLEGRVMAELRSGEYEFEILN